jgi:NAD(P)-dependent dehydrogenase (short-subunit alcohol dehydrogenase family)
MGRLENKVAVIIGAGQSLGDSIGNGRATALRFAEEGATVLAVDRDDASANEIVRMLSPKGDHQVFRSNVTDTASIKAAIDFAVAKWGRIDILHYNVGVSVAGGDKMLEDLEDEAFDRVMTINLRGAIMAAKFVQPIMRAQRSGVVLNVASMSAIETHTPLVTYRCSKAG